MSEETRNKILHEITRTFIKVYMSYQNFVSPYAKSFLGEILHLGCTITPIYTGEILHTPCNIPSIHMGTILHGGMENCSYTYRSSGRPVCVVVHYFRVSLPV